MFDVKLTEDEFDSIAFYLLMFATDTSNSEILRKEAISLYDKIRGY